MAVCPACGMKTSAKKECPRCGWNLEKNPEFECPFCGDLIPVDSDACPRCGSDLSGLSAKARASSIDKVRSVLLGDLEPIDLSEDGRYGCPKCGGLLEGTEAKCPQCGQVLISKAGLRCPACGMRVAKRRKLCPRCGSSLANLVMEARPMIPYAPPKPEQEAELEKPTRPCPVCAANVPEDMRRCPVCEAEVSGAAPEVAEPPETIPAPPVEKPVPAVETAPEHLPTPEPEIATEAPKPPSTRRLKTEQVTKVDHAVKPASRGLSNGVSHINGRRADGAGAVNGRAFVNGTGISNGLGPGPKKGPTAHHRSIVKWQLIAVILVILLLIPTVIFLGNPGEKAKYSIDGRFDEWADARMLGTRIASASPSTNFTEWAVATQGSDLFLYFETQAAMMASSEVESYYLFIDADGADSTGYHEGSIGAEYMVRLTGWDGEVNSSSLCEYASNSDALDWDNWDSAGSVSFSVKGARAEVMAGLGNILKDSSSFVLVSKDSLDNGAVTYAAPLTGPHLVVEQIPSNDVASDGIVSKAGAVDFLTLRFKSEGGSGEIDQILPTPFGGKLVSSIAPFSLGTGATKEITIALDTSNQTYGDVASVALFRDGIDSSYTSLEIIGSGATAYVGSPPDAIMIDGAFADWTGRLSLDQDSTPVADASVDIHAVGNVSTSQNSYFYVSVRGEICSGTYLPAALSKPSGSGGGTVIKTRQTAEDILNIYVDSDRSDSTGQVVTLGTKRIGADQRVEIRGLFGEITSMKEFDYSSAKWTETIDIVSAAKDESRIEISVSSASLDGSADIDFIVETTSWRGKGDLATFDASSMGAATRTWIVDPLATSPYATSMSYQRKTFYDGVNYWSFYFDGRNTVCTYSADNGTTWVSRGRVFITPGVNETSIWYDPATKTVYAVGDTSLLSRKVSVQKGVVNVVSHSIAWASSDSDLTTSSYPIAGKNTYISKDANGYIWVLATNWTQDKPLQHGLSAFRSSAVNSTSSWIDTGQILPFGMYENNSKGSIVPAGRGSDMWAVYAYEGYVAAKKYVGVWPAGYDEVVIYKADTSWDNTESGPPSVVVDGKGVVHVVYGTGRVDKSKTSIPQIFYSHNNTDSVTFTAGLNLDAANDTLGIANYYPTISLDSSTNDLYVYWLQCDSTRTPRTILGRAFSSGSWHSMVFDPQTNFPKQYLTSIYSAPGKFMLCWQWTENTTAPINVVFDLIPVPEFGDLAAPMIGLVTTFAVFFRAARHGKRSKQ